MNWILIIIIGGYFTGVSDMKHISVTEQQCKQAVKMLLPLKGKMGAGCVGPAGEVFSFEDMGE